MKTLGIILICSIYLWLCNTNAVKGKLANDTAPLRKDSVNFKTDVQPVLVKNCSPCHFPGGKLYQKLPFDNGITIISHEKGILRRIKNEEEISLIKGYILQTKDAK